MITWDAYIVSYLCTLSNISYFTFHILYSTILLFHIQVLFYTTRILSGMVPTTDQVSLHFTEMKG
jgi:hypothetical protein